MEFLGNMEMKVSSLLSIPLEIMIPVSLIVTMFLWWLFGPPRALPFIGTAIPLFRNIHRLHDFVAEIMYDEDDLTFSTKIFGMEFHTTADPVVIEHMLKTNFPNYSKGFRFHMVMEDMLGDSIFNTDGDQWKFQRKMTINGFSAHSLKTFILGTVQNEVTNRLVPVLKEACSSSSPAMTIDLQDIFMKFAFDNVCQVTLGVDPACLDLSLENGPLVQAFDDASELILKRFFLPNWLWKLARAMNVGPERKLSEALHVVHSFAMNVIARRKKEHLMKNKQEACDLLSRLMSMVQFNETDKKVGEDKKQYAGDYEKLYLSEDRKKDEFLRDTSISFMVAGRDSSSVGLTWFFWLLIKHPHIEEKIYDEVTRVLQMRKKPSLEESAKKMKKNHGAKIAPDPCDGLHGDAESKKKKKKKEMMMMMMMVTEPGQDGEQGEQCKQGEVKLGHRVHLDVVHEFGQANHVEDEEYSQVKKHLVEDKCSQALYGQGVYMGGEESVQAKSGHFEHDLAGDKFGDESSQAKRSEKSSVNDNDGVYNIGQEHSQDMESEEEEEEDFTYEELKGMTYLHAAIHEGLRLYPPVPHDIKLVEEADVLPNGTKVAKKTHLIYNAYAVARMDKIWGLDCHEFKPERWLEKTDTLAGDHDNVGTFVQVSPYKFPVFQGGPRTCIGKDMAILQMKCAAAAIIRRFRISLARPDFEPYYGIAITLKMLDGLPVNVCHRRSSSSTSMLPMTNNSEVGAKARQSLNFPRIP